MKIERMIEAASEGEANNLVSCLLRSRGQLVALVKAAREVKRSGKMFAAAIEYGEIADLNEAHDASASAYEKLCEAIAALPDEWREE